MCCRTRSWRRSLSLTATLVAALAAAAHEIDALRQAVEAGPRPDAAVQSEFKRIVFQRVLAHRSGAGLRQSVAGRSARRVIWRPET